VSESERKSRIEAVRAEILWDHNPDVSWLEQSYEDVPDDAERERYLAQDAERLAKFHAGDWWMVGVRLAADIEVPEEKMSEHDFRQAQTLTITTPGTWGVESDSGEDYFRELAGDELDMLKDDLRALRFTDEEIAEATSDPIELVERSDEDVRAYYVTR
jgi:hypothetical protein